MTDRNRDLAPGAAGAAFRAELEERLLVLAPGTADALMQALKPSLGAWAVALRAPGGRALWLGEPRSGAVAALAGLGFTVTCAGLATAAPRPGRRAEPPPAADGAVPSALGDPAELAFAKRACDGQVPDRFRAVVLDPARLPFRDRAFDVVAVDAGEPALVGALRGAAALDEARRVCAGELVLLGDNRLGYKRATGGAWDFHRLSPLEWLARAARPRAGERTLAGWRRAAAGPGFAPAEAYVLYAHRRNFAQVVALDAPRPALKVGPRERRNRPKVWAWRAGLFGALAPSFCVVAPRRERAEQPRRHERLLAALAERVGEPAPEAERLGGSRGNTCVILTCVPGADPREPAGRWALHVPLCQSTRPGLAKHHRALVRLAGGAPRLAVPAPLFAGELEGLTVVCERRLPGANANDRHGDAAAAARTFADAARDLAGLVVRPAAPLDAAELERLTTAKLALALRGVRSAAARRRLAGWTAAARERLAGAELPLVLQHADLRPKHVQTDPTGAVLGYLDWGTCQERDLPLHDLLHLAVHHLKRELAIGDRAAWERVRARRGLPAGIAAALDDHAARLALAPRVVEAVELLYPVLVGATAEEHWSYGRPRWLERVFEL